MRASTRRAGLLHGDKVLLDNFVVLGRRVLIIRVPAVVILVIVSGLEGARMLRTRLDDATRLLVLLTLVLCDGRAGNFARGASNLAALVFCILHL